MKYLFSKEQWCALFSSLNLNGVISLAGITLAVLLPHIGCNNHAKSVHYDFLLLPFLDTHIFHFYSLTSQQKWLVQEHLAVQQLLWRGMISLQKNAIFKNSAPQVLIILADLYIWYLWWIRSVSEFWYNDVNFCVISVWASSCSLCHRR